MRNTIVVCATAAMLMAGPALADHCDANIADVEWALGGAMTVEVNVLEAAEALLEHSRTVCLFEEDLIATADVDSPMSDPDYVSLGRSMLINAEELLNTN